VVVKLDSIIYYPIIMYKGYARTLISHFCLKKLRKSLGFFADLSMAGSLLIFFVDVAALGLVLALALTGFFGLGAAAGAGGVLSLLSSAVSSSTDSQSETSSVTAQKVLAYEIE
jgi:hypothetical protein